MDIFGDDWSPTQTKSVRFRQGLGHAHKQDRQDVSEIWRLKPEQNKSLDLLIPAGSPNSQASPQIGGAKSPRVHQFLHNRNVSGYDPETDDTEKETKLHSYHLDYQYTPPLVKGPCCVCGEGIVGAMVTALDKMWHPEHFRCVHCNLELIGPNYLEHDGLQYCKRCHSILFLPACSGCKKDIEGKHIKALEKVWHPDCFCCTACNRVLSETDFLTKDLKPFCEDCFHKLFSPKCQTCKKPIKDKRKIEVGGKQWHPQCFRCCECNVQLTPNNYKERLGKIYCLNDYNNLFMPKCFGCNQPILQEPTVALNKNWHPQCFGCCECQKQLNPNKFNEVAGKAYCDDCFHRLYSPKCAGCTQPIKNKAQLVQAQNKNWHPEHFCCTECKRPLDPKRFFEKNGLPYCEADYHRLFSDKCAGCAEPIKDPKTTVHALGKTWHPEHFCCTECKRTLDPKRFFEKNGLPYCEWDYHRLFSDKCAGCGEPIKDPKKTVHALGKTWHPEHFVCTVCKKQLDPKRFFEKDGLAYCEYDWHNLFSPRCAGCGLPIKDKFIFALGKHWHPEHFKCSQCSRVLQEDNFYEKDGIIYCVDDFMRLFAPKCRACSKPITTEYCLYALGGDWHPSCFRCKDCNILLEHLDFYEFEGEPLCEAHFHARMCPDCMKLRRAESRYWGIRDEKIGRPSSSLYVMATENYDPNSDTSRPGSSMSQVSSSARVYDIKREEESNWRDVRAIPIQQQSSSSYNTSRNYEEHSHNHNHNHCHNVGEPCNENHYYEKQILADANLARQRNLSGSSVRSTETSTPLPVVTLNPLKSQHQHKHEQYFESGTLPGKFPTESGNNNMKFQTIVTKDQFQTVSRNY